MRNFLLTLTLLLTASVSMAEGNFSHESQLTMIVVGGNSQSDTYNAKTINGYKFSDYKATFGGHYTLGSSTVNETSTVSVRNWDLNLRFDRNLSEKMSLFLGETVNGNKFAGYETRYNTDFGVSYSVIKTDKTTLKGDLGYRYSVEELEFKPTVGDKTNKSHQARLYAENTNKHTPTLSTKFTVEYVPNFTETDDWQLNVSPSLIMQMSSLLSLKLGYEGKYDNKTAEETHRKFDFNYTTTLIAKF